MMTYLFLIISGLFVENTAFANTGESSFTPESVLIPIRKILIADRLGTHSDVNSTIYQCNSPSLDDCLVDVADNTALAKLVSGPIQANVGTYTGVSISTCNGSEGAYDAYIRGQVILSGTTYYTTGNGQVLSQNAADKGYVKVHFTGCQRDTYFPSPLILQEGQGSKLSLFLSMKNIAWASLGPGAIPEGCTTNVGGTASICSSYADVLPSLGDATPQLKTYSIFTLAGRPETAGGQVLAILDSNGKLLGGYTRRLYSEDSAGMTGNFDTPIRAWIPNGDGSYFFENIGSTFSASYLRFSTFQLRDHSSTYVTGNGITMTYWAIEQ